MVGDTNLFLSNADTNTITGTIAEVEIMIAEESQRGKKLGYHALTLMMNYAIEHLRINQFEAEIKFETYCTTQHQLRLSLTETEMVILVKVFIYSNNNVNSKNNNNKNSNNIFQ